MTTITHTHNGKGEYYSIKGHADFNPGNDVVCAAISTITYGFINYLEEAGRKITDLETKEEPGDFEIKFLIVDFPEYEEIKRFVLGSYRMVAENYPNNVKVKERKQ